MYSYTDVFTFLAHQHGVSPSKLTPETDLFHDLGIDGDDFFELEEAYAKRFCVDMSNYLWFFHHGEEGAFNLGGLFFPAPYCRVDRMPVTPKILLDSANAGKWILEYPPHEVPEHRYDIRINRFFPKFVS